MEQSSSDNNLNANVSTEQKSHNLSNLETVLEENDAKGIFIIFIFCFNFLFLVMAVVLVVFLILRFHNMLQSYIYAKSIEV